MSFAAGGSPYSDLGRPPLNERALRRALLTPGALWRRLEVRAETGSTNADVAAAARDDEPEGLVVVAERQVAGRGRLGRSWESPARAGLSLSVLLRPGAPDEARGWAAVPMTAYGWLPLLAGVALRESVHRVTGLDASLKWPNDLLVPVGDGEGKTAGILAEGVPGAVVIGVGLNVSLRADELPDRPAGPPATSLVLAGAPDADREPLLKAFLRSLADWYARWRDTGGDAEASGLRAAYRASCGTIGRTVRVLLPDGAEVSGFVTGVDDDARLLVRTPAGDRPLAAGDVVHLR
ncbi:BirA family biotin operon repressor/biotin-[acetyl-CoA-carboxylase] ligase [Catenuloplanes nepalensis]|uniref:biotin--[biotin carboxyl-carrier protein] ligase n=1 Tax=Catenuloplanes nepalensis TaxID=587533 RepID=A0ABT9N2F7_9ACTN|nr:biotin--[acetyl-CoA-carboxylase] ligase [Catenuloplanes nepalensis]MDP9797760.1 BirA family biotin operon repressor/biotin-[acetyl-CoA-carboxylase] ligase [Catenuloplanes nepalensis]